jgi:hypothetical protein
MTWINKACMLAMLGVSLPAIRPAAGQAIPPADANEPASIVQRFTGTKDGLAMALDAIRQRNGEPRGNPFQSTPRQLLGMLQNVSDAQLESLLGNPPEDLQDTTGFELCLTEIIRRGGPYWEQNLKARYAAQRVADTKTENHNFGGKQVLLLTALRRVQKQEDPLIILVTGKLRIQTTIPELSGVEANLTNLDADSFSVWDIDSHYHIQVTDAAGKHLPQVDHSNNGDAQLISGPMTLQFGESLSRYLPVGDYVSVEVPGSYTMEVLYHPIQRIRDVPAVEGLICCKSLPIRFVIKPKTVDTTSAEQAQIAALALKLPDKGVVQLVGGPYDERLAEFMPKDSPAGQIRELGWKAVPELIKAANSSNLNPTQRAYALGLLTTITNLHKPWEDSGLDNFEILGSYEYRRSQASSSREDVRRLIGLANDIKIDEKVQIEFARVWKPWIEKGSIKLIMADGSK